MVSSITAFALLECYNRREVSAGCSTAAVRVQIEVRGEWGKMRHHFTSARRLSNGRAECLINRELKYVWEALRGKRPHYAHFLEEINIRNMRGIGDLRVPFFYPVTVLAGENACGKSTVLFGCAAAYKDPDPHSKPKTPSILFPAYSKDGADSMRGVEIGYAYIHNEGRLGMVWRRGTAWGRSYHGRKGATQPEREVYLRTLSALAAPSEVRGLLQINRRNPVVSDVPYETLLLSRKVLPFEYESVRKVEKNEGKENLLLAKLEQGRGEYSEFHMASGERSILRLSMDIAGLNNALVLIDEVEAGLHPHIQKLLMLNLQSMALRQNLQVIVTTHSPVVLDCVPPEGRIFLERDRQSHDVRVTEPVRDILQKVMYGQVDDKLSIICEDKIAEAIIFGVVDALSIKINFTPDQISVGRDTGKDSFPAHVRTMAMLDKLSDVVFVLDGDGRSKKSEVENAADGTTERVLVLPGDGSPEEWLWQQLSKYSSQCEQWLSIPRLSDHIDQAEQTITSGVAKEKHERFLYALSEVGKCEPADIARKVARHLAAAGQGEIVDFAADLEGEIQKWRRTMA